MAPVLPENTLACNSVVRVGCLCVLHIGVAGFTQVESSNLFRQSNHFCTSRLVVFAVFLFAPPRFRDERTSIAVTKIAYQIFAHSEDT